MLMKLFTINGVYIKEFGKKKNETGLERGFVKHWQNSV